MTPRAPTSVCQVWPRQLSWEYSLLNWRPLAGKLSVFSHEEGLQKFVCISRFMHNWYRSVNPEFVPINSKLERTATIIRAKIHIRDLWEPLPLAWQLREYFILSIYISPYWIRLPDVEATKYEIKSTIIQMLPSFCGLNKWGPVQAFGWIPKNMFHIQNREPH